MSTRVYKIAVVGCPRSIISAEGLCDGVGKSCLCNRFIRTEAYTEDHQQDTSVVTEDEWTGNPVYNGDHFVYWGAANKHLPDKTKVRFQIVEHTEFYKKAAENPAGSEDSEDDDYYSSSEEEDTAERNNKKKEKKQPEVMLQLMPHPASSDYISRSSLLHFRSKRQGKMGYRLKALDNAVRQTVGQVRAVTQLFPNEDFGAKKGVGIYGFVCVFDPTLEGDQMQRQLSFLGELLPALTKTKRKLAVACVKCDMVEDHSIKFAIDFFSTTTKKPIPFFEVSARDSVNVDEVFFALISSQKKQTKTLRRGHSMFISYKEVVDSRKGDLNRAKDAYRKMLQETIKDFSITWSEALRFLETNPVYLTAKGLGGSEADDMLLKMFRLRLIEIKLIEAGKEYGDSVAKKADKEHSRQYQIYLKQAFTGHPDLKGDLSYREYIPELSESDDTDILTEPSTPSGSYCRTPESRDALSRCSMVDGRDSPRYNDNRSLDDISASSSRATSASDFRHFKYSPSLSSRGRGLPPLPRRDPTAPRSSVASSSPSPSTKARKLSSSMDQLNEAAAVVEVKAKNVGGGASIDRLDVEPYLQPMEVKRVMGQSIGQSMRIKESHRNMPGFMSLRSPRRTTGQSAVQFVRTSPPEQSRTNSLDRRTHRRTHSNPHVLEAVAPQLPPRNSLESTPVHKHFASSDSCGSPNAGESSLEFSTATSVDSLRRPVVEKPLPPIPSPDLSSSSGSAVLRNQIITSTKSADIDGEDDGDNLSQQSGPFDEIEEGERKKMAASLPDLLSPSSMGGPPLQKPATAGKSRSDDDQYARIEEFQYMKMNSAPSVRTSSKGKTMPPQARKPGDDIPNLPFIHRPHSKSVSSSSQLPHAKPQRRDTITFMKRYKNSIGSETIPEELQDGEISPTEPSRRATISQDIRPLPPSPDKQLSENPMALLRKISTGSNIYEVIDDEFKNDVKNRPSRQGSRRDYLAEWAPPVDPTMWVSYLEATRAFFSLPQVQELWLDTIKSNMKDVDPEEINPPYHNANLDKLKARFPPPLQNLVEEPAQKQPEGKETERPHSTSPLEPQGKLLRVRGTVPPANTPDSLDGRISIASGKIPSPSDFKDAENKVNVALSANDFIYAFNQFQQYDSDDETSLDSDDDDAEESEQEEVSDEYDSDLDSSFARLPQLSRGRATTGTTSDAAMASIYDVPTIHILATPVSTCATSVTSSTSSTRATATTPSTSTNTTTIDNADARKETMVTDTNPPSPSPPPLPPHDTKEETKPEDTQQSDSSAQSTPIQTTPPESQLSDNSAPSTPSRTVPPVPPRPKPKPKPKPLRNPPVPRNKPEPIMTTTTAAAASDLRAMDSNDSDKVSTDSAITKSPRSVGGSGDFDLDHMMTSEEGEGVEVVHNVKPSQFLKKRAAYNKLNSPSHKSRTDSGHFEDDTLLPRTPTK